MVSITKEQALKETLVRMDGRVEWICPCGTGHTIAVPKQYEKQDAWWAHGCCGCCEKNKFKIALIKDILGLNKQSKEQKP